MLKNPLHITAISSVSALGSSLKDINAAYKNSSHFLTTRQFGERELWVGQLTDTDKVRIASLKKSNPKYKDLDASVLYALYSARNAVEKAGWEHGSNFGINIGSSRGATELFENHHQNFLKTGQTVTLTSPTTTLGNISSWVAHDLKTKGPVISHSITCSTALHGVLNAAAWIQSGLADKFLVGGSEAPLTPFTIAQMQALKIYSKAPKGDKNNPCCALDLKKQQNTMVLGEGAATICLEKEASEKSMAKIIGIGYATEPLEHGVSISAEAKCFQDSMKMALGEYAPKAIDAIVMHAPGTIKGDVSEYEAIKKVFGENHPFLTTNKWKVGHTFGASGMLSVEMALLMITQQQAIPVPFVDYNLLPKTFNKILVNAVGFGGNAVSILLSK